MPPRPERPYERHVFVCTTGPWCARDGSVEVHKRLKAAVKGLGLDDVRVNKSGCFSQCGHGPMAVLYPEAVWYGGLKPEHAERIAKEHLAGGRPVEALRYKPEKPGANKTPEIQALEAEAKARKAASLARARGTPDAGAPEG